MNTNKATSRGIRSAHMKILVLGWRSTKMSECNVTNIAFATYLGFHEVRFLCILGHGLR